MQLGERAIQCKSREGQERRTGSKASAAHARTHQGASLRAAGVPRLAAWMAAECREQCMPPPPPLLTAQCMTAKCRFAGAHRRRWRACPHACAPPLLEGPPHPAAHCLCTTRCPPASRRSHPTPLLTACAPSACPARSACPRAIRLQLKVDSSSLITSGYITRRLVVAMAVAASASPPPPGPPRASRAARW